ncbi:hypothetical protein MW871_14915 [Flavobacterium sp. I-SCBP12n]|uniref:Uncharacterized protein n=1 Tax=Flavobacterium pygoscelis TaxID=2893176 RepID=A0A9X1XTW4_9FLAO|nr:hypothetical protein [Flavobacterium pygoscelis]MCK8143179.1 hypothetical protein [Flavobacterium pygoscelis]
MRKILIIPENLLEMGFQKLKGDDFDCGGFYTWFAFYKNGNELHITYEFDKDGNFTNGYVEFNGEVLKGREIKEQDIKFLIELM